jgi:hypothetical protein
MNLFGFLNHPKGEDETQLNRRKFIAYGCACCFSSGRAFDNLYFVGSKWVCATQQLNLN